MNPLHTDDAGTGDAHAHAAGHAPHSTEAVMPACVTVRRWRWRVYVHQASWMLGVFTVIVAGLMVAAMIAPSCEVSFV
jgi:hypothetical protein